MFHIIYKNKHTFTLSSNNNTNIDTNAADLLAFVLWLIFYIKQVKIRIVYHVVLQKKGEKYLLFIFTYTQFNYSYLPTITTHIPYCTLHLPIVIALPTVHSQVHQVLFYFAILMLWLIGSNMFLGICPPPPSPSPPPPSLASSTLIAIQFFPIVCGCDYHIDTQNRSITPY